MADSLPPSEHRYGRGGFLLLVAGGASSLLWAGPVSQLLVAADLAGSQPSATSSRSGATADLHDPPARCRSSIPPADSRSAGSSSGPGGDLCEAERVPKASRSHASAHRLDGQNVHWGGVRFNPSSSISSGRCRARRRCGSFRWSAVRGLAALEQLRLSDAMLALELGGQPSLAAPWLADPHDPRRCSGYKGVKWLTKMEFVAKQPRLLGATRLRPNAWVGRWQLLARRQFSRTGALHWVPRRLLFLFGSGLCLSPSELRSSWRRPLLESHVCEARLARRPALDIPRRRPPPRSQTRVRSTSSRRRHLGWLQRRGNPQGRFNAGQLSRSSRRRSPSCSRCGPPHSGTGSGTRLPAPGRSSSTTG